MATFNALVPPTEVVGKPMYKDRFLEYRWLEADVQVITNNKEWTYHSSRGVGFLNDGVVVIPYFKREEIWYVCLVEQYRIAIDSQTLEMVGGIANDDPNILSCGSAIQAQRAMARELQEEMGIDVDYREIDIVLTEHFSNSFSQAMYIGGLIEIQEYQTPKIDGVYGEFEHGEYTVAVVRDFLSVLYEKDALPGHFDLITSRMLTELAIKTGYLTKNY